MAKYIFGFLLPVICFLQISCNDNSADSFGAAPRLVSMEISGTLPNWNRGDGYSLMAVAEVSSMYDTRKEGLDTAAISSSGAFHIVLHVINESYYTEPLSVNEPHCNTNLNPSPYYLKTVNTAFEIYQGSTYKGLVTGRAHHVGNDSVGTYYITYNAYSSAGTITGFKSCYDNDSTHIYLSEYDLATNKDWTKVVKYITVIYGSKISYSITANDPQINDQWEYSMNN
jgi:hypothetical protein